MPESHDPSEYDAGLDRVLRDGLADEVGGWSPRAAGVPARSLVARHRRGLTSALAGVVAIALVGGGLAVGLPGSGHRGPATLTAAEPTDTTAGAAPTVSQDGSGIVGAARRPSPTPSPCFTAGVSDITLPDGTTCEVGETPDATATPTSTETPVETNPGCASNPYSPPGAICPELPPTATASPSRPPSAPASTTPVVPECAAKDFDFAVSSDKPTYQTGEDISMHLSVKALQTCQTTRFRGALTGEVHLGSADGTYEEGVGGCPKHDGLVESCPPTAGTNQPVQFLWTAGQSMAVSDTWNQETVDSSPPQYATQDTYYLEAELGDLSASTSFSIRAPDCTASEITQTFTSDAASYVTGSKATFVATLKNTGTLACNTEAADARDYTPATNSAGATVWAGCGITGANPDTPCVTTTQAYGPILLQPGASSSFTKTWDLTSDGTRAEPSPQPVPPGSYAVTWLRAGNPSATITVTAN